MSSLMIFKIIFENLGPFSEEIKHIELLMTKFYEIYRQRHLLFYHLLPNFYEELQSSRVKLRLENNLVLLLVFLVVLWSYHIAFLIDNATIKEVCQHLGVFVIHYSKFFECSNLIPEFTNYFIFIADFLLDFFVVKAKPISHLLFSSPLLSISYKLVKPAFLSYMSNIN